MSQMDLQDLQDFEQARNRASFVRLLAFVTWRRDRVQSLAEVLKHISRRNETYVGLRSIAVSRIIGSESRTSDFSSGFLPLRDSLVHRWSKVNEAFRSGAALPAITVLELNGRYYVRDGNHRVSVARFHRVEYIDVNVR